MERFYVTFIGSEFFTFFFVVSAVQREIWGNRSRIDIALMEVTQIAIVFFLRLQ